MEEQMNEQNEQMDEPMREPNGLDQPGTEHEQHERADHEHHEDREHAEQPAEGPDFGEPDDGGSGERSI